MMGEDATLHEIDFRPPVDLLLTGKDTGGRLLLIRSLERQDCEPHRHRNEDEIVYVLDGELTYYLGEHEHLELDEAGREDDVVTVERLVTVAARHGVEITGSPRGTKQRTTVASKVDHASKPGRRERT
jgi:hypothetical protein